MSCPRSWLLAAALLAVPSCEPTLRKRPLDSARLLGRFRMSKLEGAQRRLPGLLQQHRGSSAYVLLRRTVEEHVLTGRTWSVRRSRLLRYIVLDPDDARVNAFRTEVPKHWSLRRVSIVVRPRRGSPVRYRRDQLHREDGPYGARRYKLAYARVDRGAVIEVREVKVLPNALEDIPWYHRVSLRLRLPAERIEHHLIYPHYWRIHGKQALPSTRSKVDASERRVGAVRHVRLVHSNVPALPDEPLSPPRWISGQYLARRLQFVQVGERRGSRPLKWSALASQLWRELDLRVWYDGALGRAVKTLTKAATSAEQRLRIIDAYVREQLRVDRFAKRSFGDVLRSRRGTAFQLTALTAAMLREAGLKAEFTLIHDARDGHFDERFVTVSELDVPAVAVSLRHRKLLLFPYMRHVAPGQHPWWVQGQRAMSLRGSSDALWWTVPVARARADRIVERLEVELTASGDLRVRETVRRAGLAAQRLRGELADLHPSALRRTLWRRRRAAAAEPLARPTLENLTKPTRPLLLRYRYRIAGAASRAGSALVLRPGGLLERSGRLELTAGAKRQRLIAIPNAMMLRREVLLRYPKRLKLSSLPKDTRMRAAMGEASTVYRREGAGKLRIIRRWKLRRGSFPPTFVEELRKLLRGGAAARMPPLIFVER